jgi:uncharacterized protein (TIGR00269 family)
VRKVKPLCRFYEREMAAYAVLKDIPYIYDECPNSQGSSSIFNKGLLNILENEQPGAKLRFYLKFLEARKQGFFNPPQPQILELHTNDTGCMIGF